MTLYFINMTMFPKHDHIFPKIWPYTALNMTLFFPKYDPILHLNMTTSLNMTLYLSNYDHKLVSIQFHPSSEKDQGMYLRM